MILPASVTIEMKAPIEEVEIYNRFASDLARGVDVVDRKSYEMIIDSRRKELLKRWLAGKSGLFLDYGCGDGSFSRFIKEELAAVVVGVDVSALMARYASARGKGVNYLVADCHALPFKNESFDAVVGIGIFHHLNLKTAMFECSRVLRRGGFLVTFEPNSLGLLSFMGRKLFKTKIHTPSERTYAPWSFVNEMKNRFQVVDLQFLSFLGFVFPFLWASKFGHAFASLRRYAMHLKTVDRLFENIPITKYLCWLFMVVGVKP
jgi:ubiquinone/menaquinone biosynthesis C-methylase UbiE